MELVSVQSPLELLQARLDDARAVTDRLFGLVDSATLYEARPIRERHRLVFYLGHLEAFDWNLLNDHLMGAAPWDAELDRLFAFGIDPLDDGLPADLPGDWPVRTRVDTYIRHARAAIDRLLGAGMTVEHSPRGHALGLLLNTAIEHRLMHAETLAYLLHRLPPGCKYSEGPDPDYGSGAPRDSMLAISPGTVQLGQRAGQFGWDNEFEAGEAVTEAFEIDRYMVSNGAFLAFIDAGGYQDPRWWNEASWAWREAEQINHPANWVGHGKAWRYQTMFDEIPLPLAWPVYVSHAEASAYACWAGKRLPGEAEWQRAALGAGVVTDSTAPAAATGNFDFQRWDPLPVDHASMPVSPFGAVGMWGNGWEWTRDTFSPYPGFASYPFYPGYSADFFDTRHYVMKGGSARTAARLLRPSFRNWFQPHYQHMYAGFRCVRD